MSSNSLKEPSVWTKVVLAMPVSCALRAASCTAWRFVSHPNAWLTLGHMAVASAMQPLPVHTSKIRSESVASWGKDEVLGKAGLVPGWGGAPARQALEEGVGSNRALVSLTREQPAPAGRKTWGQANARHTFARVCTSHAA